MNEKPSERLLDQRLRNRMMEQLLMLVEWEDTLALGANEYFNSFFDFFPDRPPLDPNSTLTEDERDGLVKVLALMDEAASTTDQHLTNAQLIASGWPQRIAQEAQSVLSLMRARGKFSEESEEAEPSGIFEI